MADTAESRRLRRRGLKSAYLTGIVGRGVGVATPLVLIPLLLPALGASNFGVWATAVSFTSMLVFADLGLGSGLLTALSSTFGNDDLSRGRRLVGDSYFALSLIALAGMTIVLLVARLTDISSWFGGEVSGSGDAEGILVVVSCGFFATIPLSLITRVQLGVQQGWQNNVWSAVGPLLSLPLVYFLTVNDAPPVVIVAGVVAGPLVVTLANNLVFFLGSNLGRALSPSLSLISRSGMRDLLTLGSAFAGVSILSNVALNIDNVLISLILGSAQVTTFVIAARLFAAVALLVNIVGMPLWGANGEALARRDFDWIGRTTYRTAFALCGTVICLTIPAVVFREAIIGLWVGPSVEAPLLLFSGFAAWSALVAFTTPFFAVQNAAGMLRIQGLGWGAYLVISVTVKLFALSVVGVSSLAWITAVCYGLTVTPSAILGYYKVIEREKSREIPSDT